MPRHPSFQRAFHKKHRVTAHWASRFRTAPDERLLAIYSAVTVGVVVRDPSGAVLHVNAAAEEILNRSFATLREHSAAALDDLQTEDGADLPFEGYPSMVAARTGRAVRGVILSQRRAPDSLRWLRVDAVPLFDASGRVQEIVCSLVDITAQRQAATSLAHQALHDSLTDLPNRTLLHIHVQQAVRAAARDGATLALLLLDLDRFKDINATLGHNIGDRLLQQIGPRLRTLLRDSDVVARLGGDEFAILLPLLDAHDDAMAVAEKVVASMRQPFQLLDAVFHLGVSIGIALYPEHGADSTTLLRHADVAMYLAKQSQSEYALYTPEQDQHSPNRLALIGEFRTAMAQNQLVLYYQPKVDMRTGRVHAVEALLRWQHPLRGLLPPAEFVPLAERSGLSKALDWWVLDAAVRQAGQWQKSGFPLRVEANLSARNLRDPQLVPYVSQLLARYDLPADLLGLEITEGSLMADPGLAEQTLTRLATMGVALAVDDFGTGYSSLAYLKRLPVTELKIDKSFVLEIPADLNDVAIVRSTIGLGHNLGLSVIAEGVETRAAWNLLADLGCDLAQGYYLSRPLAADALLHNPLFHPEPHP